MKNLILNWTMICLLSLVLSSCGGGNNSTNGNGSGNGGAKNGNGGTTKNGKIPDKDPELDNTENTEMSAYK